MTVLAAKALINLNNSSMIAFYINYALKHITMSHTFVFKNVTAM